jgi:hypothetical protein
MARFPLTTLVTLRSCDECQACCTVVGVTELEKGTWTRCTHQCEQGCAVYERRPETCRGYSCLWQAGLLEGDERRRPDKLGIVCDLRHEGVRPVVQVWEVWPGAFQQPNVVALLQQIATRCFLALRPYRADRIQTIKPNQEVRLAC